MTKPKVTTNPVANQYAGDNERIIEFSDAKLQIGGLIALRRTDDGRLTVQVYRQDEGVDVSYEGEGKRIEVLHVRDPDEGCFYDVFVDGQLVRDLTVEDVDPGRGYERVDWDEHTRDVRNDENYSEAFKAAVIAARDFNADSKYVTGEPATLEERAGAWFEEASKGANARQEQAVLSAVLMLALTTREQFPNADRLVLSDSDQGPWVAVDKVLDADGNDLDPDWDIFDDDGLASWLEDNWRSVWTQYAPQVNDSRTSPIFELKIGDVLARIEPPT